MKAFVVLSALIAVAAAGVFDPIFQRPGPSSPVIKPEVFKTELNLPNDLNPFVRIVLLSKEPLEEAHRVIRDLSASLLLPQLPADPIFPGVPSLPGIERPLPPARTPEINPVVPGFPEIKDPGVPSLPGIERPLPPARTPEVNPVVPGFPEIKDPGVPAPEAPVAPPTGGPQLPVEPTLPEIVLPVPKPDPRILFVQNKLVKVSYTIHHLNFVNTLEKADPAPALPETSEGQIHLRPKPMPTPKVATPGIEIFMEIGEQTEY